DLAIFHTKITDAALSTRTTKNSTPPSTGRSGRVGRRIAVTDRDEVELEEANEQRAIAAYEKHMGVSADDPAYGPDLSQWMAGWNAALAQQPAPVAPVGVEVDGEALARRFHETYERLAPSFGYETRTET